TLNALRSRLPSAFFAQNGDPQAPDLVINLAESSFGKLARWCDSFLELRNVFQRAIDLILWQRSENSLHVLNLRNAMADHRQVVSHGDREANRSLQPIFRKNRAHVEIVRQYKTTETEFVTQQIGDDPPR